MHFIYFNTRGTQGGSTQIKNMLTYIQDSRHENVVDKTTEIVDSLVSRVKNAEEVRGSYMTFGDVIDREKKESFEAGKTEGLELGEERGIEKGIQQGKQALLFELVKSGAITIENAAHSLEIGNKDFLKLMN